MSYERDNIVDVDPRFDRPQSPAWKRAVLVALLAVLFWLAFHLRPGAKHQPKVTYATRFALPFPPYDDATLMLVRQVLGRVQISACCKSCGHGATQGRESATAGRTPNLIGEDSTATRFYSSA
ncbi:hypothetical protein JVT61DRAFT_10487 [Boletus reticuloceps]|uniref:Uncharacterized protein n=1 Tax=Boletus reticuloceps TaxID=495285 RepID=A0A8I3AC38_9AGAM|nr:hypothetical protein JVT61DRAFT_10487 [Boletus reticuloceps]